MQLTKFRTVTLGAIAAALSLAWALPAFAHTGAAKAAVVTVTAGKPSEFRFTLAPKTVKHGVVTFKVTNKGSAPHDFKVCSSSKGGTALTCAGTATPQISAGATATLKVTFKTAGKYEYLCTLPGHAASGMKGVLTVT